MMRTEQREVRVQDREGKIIEQIGDNTFICVSLCSECTNKDDLIDALFVVGLYFLLFPCIILSGTTVVLRVLLFVIQHV